MIKELLISSALGVVIGGGSVGSFVKFWADNTYTHKDEHEHEHETMVAGFDQSMRKSTEQAQIYALQKQIKKIRSNAARAGKPLTQFDLNDIKEIETEIDNLKGWSR